MDQIYRIFNAVMLVFTVGAGGYMTYETSGFGLLAEISPPDDAWFRAHVLKQSQPVIVKFGASWCGPCRRLDPELDRLASTGDVTVVRIDIQRSRDLARHYRVSSIPHLFLFHNGALVAQRKGFADYDHLRKWSTRTCPPGTSPAGRSRRLAFPG